MTNIIRRGLDGLALFLARSSPEPIRAIVSAAVEPLESRLLFSAGPGFSPPQVRPADANGAPPAVAISAPNVTSASQATEEIAITFTDSAGIDPTSIAPGNITVVNQTTGAMLSVTGATLSPADGSSTMSVATYSVAAPDADGMFTNADNGTYSVVLGLNQVFDPDGDEAPQAGASFTINVVPAGATAPTAAITPPATVTTALPSVNVTVIYSATAGGGDLIDASTINTKNITVSGPNGALTVSAVSVNPAGGNAGALVATYTVPAPGGAFTLANDGPHTIKLNPNQPVQDTNGLIAVSHAASVTFSIALPSALAAAINPPSAVTVAQPTESIAVVYSDASPINLTTIAPGNIVVTEEGVTTPTPLTVTAVSLNPASGSPTQVTATYTVAAPGGSFSLANSGTYDVELQANQVQDVNQVFAEPVSSSFQVNVPGSFSLTLTFGRLKLPTAVAAGASLKLPVPVTVTNHGTIASVGKSTLTLYASTTPGLTGATEVASTTANLRLKANKAKAVNLKLASLPATLPTGDYYLVVEITDANGNSAVAATASTVSVSPPFIDLAGSLPPVPATLKAARKTSFTVTVANDGNVTAAGSLQVEFLARPTGTTGDADVLLATPSARIKLAAGTSKRIRLPLTLPQTLSAGTDYTLVAVLDPANLLNDGNPTDNTLVGNYIFTVD